MEQKTFYQTTDGEPFITRADALAWERERADPALRTALQDFATTSAISEAAAETHLSPLLAFLSYRLRGHTITWQTPDESRHPSRADSQPAPEPARKLQRKLTLDPAHGN